MATLQVMNACPSARLTSSLGLPVEMASFRSSPEILPERLETMQLRCSSVSFGPVPSS